jgi:hypothetical protein
MGRCHPDPADLGASGADRVGFRGADHRRNPVEAMQIMVRGRLRVRLWLGLHALLRDQLHLHRPRRRRGLPRAAVQHRRRGAGRPRRSRRRHRAAELRLAALDHRASGRDPRCGAVRRGLGRDPGLSAGQARQPYRDHHDHVQLHRLRAAGLPAGQRLPGRGLHGPRKRALRRGVHLPSAADFAGSSASVARRRSTSPSSSRFCAASSSGS